MWSRCYQLTPPHAAGQRAAASGDRVKPTNDLAGAPLRKAQMSDANGAMANTGMGQFAKVEVSGHPDLESSRSLPRQPKSHAAITKTAAGSG
jgi:hypothetical protein